MLSVKNVYKTYVRKKQSVKKAVCGVTFTIQKGEIFSLLGVNGAGKTTLSEILAGLHPPTSGDILYQGKSIYSNILEYRNRLGFCPQKPNIDPNLTVSEMLVFVGRCYGQSLSEATAQRDRLIDLFDLGSDAHAVAQHLSGGYKQRFLLARTLAHHPNFVILDEPTVGLDPQVRNSLWSIIQNLRAQGVTILLTTHYLEEAESLSDRVCFIERGQIRALDTPKNLYKTYGKSSLEELFLHLMDQVDQEVSL